MANTSARILWVDDDKVLSGIYQSRMEMEGFSVLHCKDGQEAIEKFKEFNPDLILLDLMTPRVSGFDVIDAVRHTQGVPQPKILVLSATSEPDNKQRANQLGADEYLVKSQISLDDVMLAINRHLGLNGNTPAKADA